MFRKNLLAVPELFVMVEAADYSGMLVAMLRITILRTQEVTV
jgi:hypothetical protein